MRLAMLELKVAIIKFLKAYRIERTAETQVCRLPRYYS